MRGRKVVWEPGPPPPQRSLGCKDIRWAPDNCKVAAILGQKKRLCMTSFFPGVHRVALQIRFKLYGRLDGPRLSDPVFQVRSFCAGNLPLVGGGFEDGIRGFPTPLAILSAKIRQISLAPLVRNFMHAPSRFMYPSLFLLLSCDRPVNDIIVQLICFLIRDI